MSVCPILPPLKWSDQGRVNDLPQADEASSCQSSEDTGTRETLTLTENILLCLVQGKAPKAATEGNALLLMDLQINGRMLSAISLTHHKELTQMKFPD